MEVETVEFQPNFNPKQIRSEFNMVHEDVSNSHCAPQSSYVGVLLEDGQVRVAEASEERGAADARRPAPH